MATCQTSRWTSTAPYIKLTVTQSASTDTTATLSWTLQYIADYAASTSVAKSYSVVINGSTVKSGTYSINGKTGTHTIASGTVSITKGTAAKSIAFSCSMAFNLTWSGTYGGTKSASGSISVAAKTSYTVKYDANGGSGAPASQTKWYGTALTLSSAAPTRTGYTFKGWATSAGGSVAYAVGASYTANAAVTLYAVWQAVTYAVKYNANGGSGAPSSQTKTYGTALTLSSTKPTRTNYTFKGWATSASGGVAYTAGGSYTANEAVTLYAVWELAYEKPRITNLAASRTAINGNVSSAQITCNCECDKTISNIVIEWESTTKSGSKTITPSKSSTSYAVNTTIGDGALSMDETFTIRVKVTDASDYSYAFGTLTGNKFVIDFLAGGNGAAFNKAAELDGVLDVGFETYLRGGLRFVTLEPETDLDDVQMPNFYIGDNIGSNNYLNCPLTSGTFTLIVESAGDEGQVKQVLTRCSKTEPNRYMRMYYQGTWGEWISDTPSVIYVQETGTNLNDYVMTGTYYFNSSHTPTNYPGDSVNGWLTVIRADSGAIKQLWHRFGTQNTNDFCTYVRTGNGTSWSGWKQYATQPEVLYNNATGTYGTVTLAETAANFSMIEIIVGYADIYGAQSVKVYSPNGKTVDLSSLIPGTNSLSGVRTRCAISGKSIAQSNNLRSSVTNTTWSSANNIMYIKTVIGYR